MELGSRDASTPTIAQNDIGWQALAPALACTLLATLVVAARWYTRCRIAKCTGPDDWIILLSLILSIAMTALIGAEVHSGVGRYDADVPATTVAKLVVATNDLWILVVNVTKASILTQYLRIFSSRVIRMCCIILLLCLLPAVAWGVFGGTFLCSPVAKLWDPSMEGSCMSAVDYWYSVAGIDIGLDFLILLLPLPAIVRLRLPRKQKLGLVLVFLLGFFVCVVSVVRVCTVLVSSLKGDYVASGVWAIVWSAVEANVGIVCASLLALKPLVVRWWPGVWVEEEVPKHCLRLPRVETEVGEEEKEMVAEDTRATSMPVSPSKGSQSWSRRDTVKTMSSNGSVSSPWSAKVGGCPIEAGRREGLSLFDVLHEEASLARIPSRPERSKMHMHRWE
ncbi:uncharacterized protein LTR77_009854 [Saxophila tyrrhenica]|uniref:Rhodopsin domain-containing protein n=1 Tax=Saxophila tyrrhenica TaxID=1690608 RepID=A0AAV9P1A5_9PEZI|nr:hypothetical protein LTR77_009854 [Saxophila tyrrhenica]